MLAVIVLTPSREGTEDQEVRLDELPKREAFIQMMRQTFLLDIADRGRYSQLMQSLGRIIPRIRAYKLTLPHNFHFLPQARQMILDRLSADTAH